MEDYSHYYSREDSNRHPTRAGHFFDRRKHASLPYRLDRDGDAQMAEASTSSTSNNPAAPQRGLTVTTRGGHIPRSRSQSLVHEKDRSVFSRLGPRSRGGPVRPGFQVRPRPQQPNEVQWHKIRIPGAVKADRNWLLKTLQDNMSVPLNPIQLTVDGNSLVFYVNDQIAFRELRNLHRTLSFPTGGKVPILVNQCQAPVVQLDDSAKEKIKTVMSRRYNPSSFTLSLNRFNEDPAFKEANLSVQLGRHNAMKVVMELIEANLPNLRSLDISGNRIAQLSDLSILCGKVPLRHLNLSDNNIQRSGELDRIKNFSMLEELNLSRNPMRNEFRDTPTYVENIRRRLPQITRLDDVDLPRKIGFDAPAKTSLPLPVPVHVPQGEEAKQQLKMFVTQFFLCFDMQRQNLLEAYAEDAKFSLLVSRQSDRNSGLMKFNRNLFNIHNNDQRIQRFYIGKRVIIDFFATLPITEHILESFTMDVFFSQDSLVGFTVGGLFKEISLANQTRRVYEWAFARNFMVKIVAHGLQIISDNLNVSMPTADQKKQIAVLWATPTVNATTSAIQPQIPQIDENTRAAMVAKFSVESGMNELGSRRALEENAWDYNRAAEVFLQLQSENRIPVEFFVK